MSNPEIKPLERLFLWRLAVTDGGWLSGKEEVKPKLSSAARKRLESAGLIDVTRQKNPITGGHGSFMVLGDKGWAVLAGSLDDGLATPSNAGAEIFGLFLRKLKSYLDGRNLSLGDLFVPAEPPVETMTPTAAPSPAPIESVDGNGDAARRIASAYLGLSGGQANVRVRLSDLRRATPSIPRAEFDRALFDLEASGEASLYRLDNPHEIGPEDREAVVRTPLGEDRHIIYLGGRRS